MRSPRRRQRRPPPSPLLALAVAVAALVPSAGALVAPPPHLGARTAPTAFAAPPTTVRSGRHPRLPTGLRSTAAPVNGAAPPSTDRSEEEEKDAPPPPTVAAGSDEEDPFALLASLAATTLLQSDRRRDAVGKDAGAQASSATNWIDEGSAFALRSALDRLKLSLPGDDVGGNYGHVLGDGKDGRERTDEAVAWLRWMRSMPRPIVVDLSAEARAAANATASDEFLALLDAANVDGASASDADATILRNTPKLPGPSKMRQLRTEFLDRLSCRLVLLPSGQGLRGGLVEPPGSLTFGKLLCGGVTRYRLLPSGGADREGIPRPPRRAGERTERKPSKVEHVPCWAQYGGTERKYDAVDMGPAMVLEWSLLPKIRGSQGCGGANGEGGAHARVGTGGDMTLRKIAWSPHRMFRYVDDDDDSPNDASESETNGEAAIHFDAPATLQGKDRNAAFTSDFRARVGGLGPQIDSIVRRVLDGRVLRPAEVDAAGNLLSYKEAKSLLVASNDGDALSPDGQARRLSLAALEAEELASLGLTPVRGLLLHGPPGCGKTALAREIARALRARAPKIVSAPELLDRWVGGSERLVRELFHDAEAELASVGGDPSRSALHVIVIDEIDATFRKRTSAEDSGEATRSSTVNQILAKLDGVEAISNVLLIGMTNRRELLDEALLRPGRLEVQIEIPLPDMKGRREILNIHFGALRSRGRLSQPLCSAIDGPRGPVSNISEDDDSSDHTASLNGTKGRKRRALKRATNNIVGYLSVGKRSGFDLASDAVTGGFSGADLEGLVRCAGSIALSRAREEGAGVDSLLITLDDIKQALVEVKA